MQAVAPAPPLPRQLRKRERELVPVPASGPAAAAAVAAAFPQPSASASASASAISFSSAVPAALSPVHQRQRASAASPFASLLSQFDSTMSGSGSLDSAGLAPSVSTSLSPSAAGRLASAKGLFGSNMRALSLAALTPPAELPLPPLPMSPSSSAASLASPRTAAAAAASGRVVAPTPPPTPSTAPTSMLSPSVAARLRPAAAADTPAEPTAAAGSAGAASVPTLDSAHGGAASPELSPSATTSAATSAVPPAPSMASAAAAAALIASASAHAGAPAPPGPGDMPPFLGQEMELEFLTPHMETHPALTQAVVGYLDLKSVQALCLTSQTMREIVMLMAAPMQVSAHKPSTPLDASAGSSCLATFKTWGRFFSGLSLHRTPMADKASLPTLLGHTRALRRLTVHDCDVAHWSDEAMGDALRGLPRLEELRLHCSDLAAYDHSPYICMVRALAPPVGALCELKKLTLFTRLDAQGTAALAAFLQTPQLSRRLTKLKLSTSLVSSPGGVDVLAAVGKHGRLQKLTIMRPEGMGEPIRKSQCAVLATVMVQCTSLFSLHLRRAGMWTDTLAALVPAKVAPNMRNIKLDSNSLAYLSAAYFNEAMDLLLSRLPNLESLHLGNNQLDSAQAVALAASLTRHRVQRLCNLTLGSNDIGDVGLAAILKALPSTMKQLYLHGCDIHDEGLEALRLALAKMPDVWGLGLNGNPISDQGVGTLARALEGRDSLRDIGITLSDVTDAGIQCLADSVATCRHLRFIYLYTSGFKAATKITEQGKAYLRSKLPPYATAAFDHKLSRYLKAP